MYYDHVFGHFLFYWIMLVCWLSYICNCLTYYASLQRLWYFTYKESSLNRTCPLVQNPIFMHLKWGHFSGPKTSLLVRFHCIVEERTLENFQLYICTEPTEPGLYEDKSELEDHIPVFNDILQATFISVCHYIIPATNNIIIGPFCPLIILGTWFVKLDFRLRKAILIFACYLWFGNRVCYYIIIMNILLLMYFRFSLTSHIFPTYYHGTRGMIIIIGWSPQPQQEGSTLSTSAGRGGMHLSLDYINWRLSLPRSSCNIILFMVTL